MEKIILEADPSRVIEGLRDTGYDFKTAMADLVDNSIAANATSIKVRIQEDSFGKYSIFIADNGDGMDLDGLKNAMRYGSAARLDKSSLGKFGMGLKTASTAFCRCLSVISKKSPHSTGCFKVQWDLDEIAKSNQWELFILQPNEDEIELLQDVSIDGTGTLVVWEKVDRLIKSYSSNFHKKNAYEKLIKDLKFHFSLVFQRFLDPQIKSKYKIDLFVNDEKILPWDPFCTHETNTDHLADEVIEVIGLVEGGASSFSLTGHVLPRKEEFSSKESYEEARVNNEMQGFYVYRENRLIYQGSLGVFTKDPHFSLLRMNFSFNHELDEAFNVDIKKSKISLNEEIYSYLKNSFLPALRRHAENKYRKGQISKVAANTNQIHDASNTNINSKAANLLASKITVTNPNLNSVEISNSNGTFVGTIKVLNLSRQGQCRVIPVDSIESGLLWEPTIVEGNHAVSINQSHDYYSKIYAANLQNPVLIQGLDALLWALAEAEMSTYSEETKEQYEEMRIQVSRIIKNLVRDLPEPDLKNIED
jgi:hypothetical protein